MQGTQQESRRQQDDPELDQLYSFDESHVSDALKIEELQKKCKQAEQTSATLLRNLQTLYKTAKEEIRRKDAIISDLQERGFQPQPPATSPPLLHPVIPERLHPTTIHRMLPSVTVLFPFDDMQELEKERILPREESDFILSFIFTSELKQLPALQALTTTELTPIQIEAREIFRELIEINTSHQYGSARAADAIAARFLRDGWSPDNVQVLRHPGHPEKGNIVIRYRGSSATLRPALFIAHLDVVEADPADWETDPFTFIEKEDGGQMYYYGRGTSDIKNEAAEMIANFLRLRREGFQSSRDLILALTEDEEGGGTCNGIQYLLDHHRDLIDCAFCINTDAGSGQIKQGRYLAQTFQTAEKVYMVLGLGVTNPGGHSSLPTRDNAIYHLAGGLSRLAEFDFPARLSPTVRLFMERMAPLEADPALRTAMADLAAHGLTDTHAATLVSQASPYYHALLHTTVVATMITGGHAENALPQAANATLNCRLLPDDDPAEVERLLAGVLNDTQIGVGRLVEPLPAPASPIDRGVLGPVEEITQAMWPGVPVLPEVSPTSHSSSPGHSPPSPPVMLTLALHPSTARSSTMPTTPRTDGQTLRHAGIPVYGVSGMFYDIDDYRCHGRNERLLVRSFFEGLEFMYRLMRRLGAPE
ncbi:putative peptidase M20 [Paratrimastix pyriformis]|uniref:Peptidase M20 n=1 Tax=Paratrimastix pyriformis TaxID=342808 RepID=A0ABQ8UCS5_9EUKA|nr:putative peptidase M20 [Paratrimastix pyriformis]